MSSPLASYYSHKNEIDTAIRRVLEKGRYMLGLETDLFEKEFAAYLGVRRAVAVASGTQALHLALSALEIGEGDEVITTSYTAVATVAAIRLCGAVPVLIDMNPDTLNIDPRLLVPAITSRTRAILPVHLFGRPCDMSTLCAIASKHGLAVIEDCAQAHGAAIDNCKVGTFGLVAAFSFYPTKNLSAVGDAGIAVTQDDAIADRIVALRQYGWDQDRVSNLPGWNARMDEIQAAVLRVKLPYLENENLRRIRIAESYTSALRDLQLQVPSLYNGEKHVFHQYVIRTNRRDMIRAALLEESIPVEVHYPLAVHQQPGYAAAMRPGSSLAECEKASRELLSLPIFPEMPDSAIEAITQVIRRRINS